MGELWDVLDADRRPTGRVVERRTSPKDEGPQYLQPGEYHVVAVIALFSGEQMLIQQRADEKDGWPGYWDLSCAGSVQAGETSAQGAARELAEEVGIHADLVGVRPAMSISFPLGFEDYYMVETPPDLDLTTLVLQKEEVQAVRWATCSQINAMIASHEFVTYQPGLIDLLFAMHRHSGALARWWFED